MTAVPGLEAAIESERRGDTAGARRIGEDALARDPNDAALLRFLGILCFRHTDLPAAVDYLTRAVSLDDKDIGARLALTKALVGQGRLADALAACPADPPPATQAETWSLRGYLLQSLGRPAEAIPFYEKVVGASPEDWESWTNLGTARLALGEPLGAALAFEEATRLQPKRSHVYLNKGLAFARLGRAEESVTAFEEAIRVEPHNVAALLELGRALNRLDRRADAVSALARAAIFAPGRADIHLERGTALANLRRMDEAESAYRTSLAIEPAQTEALFGLGLLLERANRLEELEALLESANASGAFSDRLRFLSASLLRRRGELGPALALLQALPETIEPQRRARLIGKLADSLGDADTAFAAFSEMNRLAAQSWPEARAVAADNRRHIGGVAALTTPAWYKSWQPIEPDATRSPPVFLVGFPRSGTTLLDTMLMGHPNVRVLEELPTLSKVAERLGSPGRLAQLGTDEADALRDLYYAEVAGYVDPEFDGLIVDKMPMAMLGGALIHRLFPTARIVLAERHPCDVVLSCFMQNFSRTPGNASFLDLGEAARLYDLAQRLWLRSRSIFPLDVHAVRYEALVERPEEVLRPLLDFLGLPWDDKVLDTQRTAEARGHIATASYDQVTESIYRHASGRWRRYAAHMADVLPILLPWAKRLGYDA